MKDALLAWADRRGYGVTWGPIGLGRQTLFRLRGLKGAIWNRPRRRAARGESSSTCV